MRASALRPRLVWTDQPRGVLLYGGGANPDFENARECAAYVAGYRAGVGADVRMLQLDRLPAPTDYIPTSGTPVDLARAVLAPRRDG
jgi:hypothetical protein